MRRASDRRAAAALVLVSVVAVVLPAALSRAPLPPAASSAQGSDGSYVSDPAAVANLLAASLREGSSSWSAVFAYTRSVPGTAGAEGTIVEARLPPWRVVATGDSLTADFGESTLQCTVTDDGPQCIDSEAADPPLAPASVYAAVVALGAYRVTRDGRVEIAGERADCFSLVSNVGGALPGLGLETNLCFAADGVPLSTRVVQAGATDTRTALQVRRDIGEDDLRAILAPFGAQDRLPG